MDRKYLPDEVWDAPYNRNMARFLRTDLAAMHLLAIKRLQSKLVREGLEHRYLDLPRRQPDSAGLGPDADYARSTMRQYVTALQDYDYMRQCALDGRHGPFVISSESKSGHALLKEHLDPLADLNSLHFEENPNPDVFEEFILFRTFITANMTYWKAYLQRLSAALAVSLFLVAPMVITIFVPELGQKRASVVAAGFILIFAVTAAVVFKEILGVVSATAAYAAVLVVFVSTGQAVTV